MEAQLPNNFQVELVEGCTKMCSFCGIYSIWKNKEDRKINLMDFKLVQRIADDIGQWIPKRRIEFAMHGEPTLYPKLVEAIEYYRNKISESQLMITTNGTRLTENLILDLFKVGVNLLVIDTYTKREEIIDLVKKTIEKDKSIKLEDYYYDENPTNIYYYHNPKIKIITLLEDFAKTNKPGSKIIKAQRIILNHAGNSNIKLLKEKFGIPIITDWLQKKCSRPFREMTVHWDGTVPICCFTGDTLIPMLDNTLRPIKELVNKEFYVYSWDLENNKPAVSKAYNCHMTHEKSRIIEVTIDNQEIIKCTEDHLFLLSTGEYKKAIKLRPGDSLMPLYRDYRLNKGRISGYKDPSQNKYEFIFNPMTNKWIPTHWIADNYAATNGLYGLNYLIKNFHRHHKDFNHLNNIPTNMFRLTLGKHLNIHRKFNLDHDTQYKYKQARSVRESLIAYNISDQHKKIARKTMIIKNRKEDIKCKQRLGYFANKIKKEFESKKVINISPSYLLWISKSKNVLKLSTKDIIQKYFKDCSIDFQNEIRRKIKLFDLKINHRVVSVILTNRYEPVYDFTVEKHHNFALGSGVFVHNCMDWLHEFIVDKFGKRSLKDIWNDLIFNIARNLLYNKYRGFLPCYRCSYKGGFYLGFLKPVPLKFTREQMLGILSSYHNQMKKYAHKNAVDPFFPPQKNLRERWVV